MVAIRKRTRAKRAAETKAGIYRDLVVGIGLIVAVIAVKSAVEHTEFGQQLSGAMYNFLQSRLVAERPAVAIVDISDLIPERLDVNGRAGLITPRAAIRDLVRAIANQGPTAIGVDIDFSPDDEGFIHPADPDFFRFCLDIGKTDGVPVFLGIGRTAGFKASEWLGTDEFAALAANIVIPNDSRRMAYSVGGSRSMSAALAGAHAGATHDEDGWLERTGLIESRSAKQLRSDLEVKDYLVDYSALDAFDPLKSFDPLIVGDASQRKIFNGKIVLIGDATPGHAADTFIVPRRAQPYPGVYLHASAAYTLTRAPLYEVTPIGRFAIDFAFGLAVLVPVIALRLHYRRKPELKVASHRVQGWLTTLVVVIALAAGVMLVRVTRVMWDDFLLALTVLALHPAVERFLHDTWQRIRKGGPPAVEALIFESDKDGD